MSLNPDIRDQAYQFFIEEAQELLQVLEDGLLDLRQDHSIPKVHELMRAAHSIKGGAASVNLGAIELLAHRLEDFFKALYSDSVEFDAELETLLLQGFDCLRHPLAEQIGVGSFDKETALLTAEPIFSALSIRLEDALKNSDSYMPSSTDLGVDIVSSIFEVDVAQSLEHLTAVFSNPENYEVAGELRAQLEVFAGFAELFNLPGFSDIIQIAQAALDNSPDRVLEVLEATIADCNLAKDAVLSGDRNQGGVVSPALMALAQSATTGDEFFDNPDAASQDNLWSSDSTTDSFADDIFSMIPDEPAIAETVEASHADIDDIFGMIPDEPAVEAAIAETVEASHADIDDIFGMIPDETTVEPAIAETVESDDGDIDDIFGMIPDEPAIAETVESTDADIEPVPDKNQDSLPKPESIDAAIESIGAIFDRLPVIENLPSSLSFTAEKTQVKQSQTPKESESTTAKQNAKTTANLSVRVDLERLDRMNNLVGELTINRNSLSLQNQQLQDNVGELTQKFFRFREVTKKLREISDKMVIEQRSESFQRDADIPESDRSTEFDSLEMDSYSLLHSSLQGVLEEIVQLEESVEDIVIFAKQSDRTIDTQRQMLGQMRDELMWVRMLPLEQILQRFPRTLRDLSTKYQKPVELKLTGTGVLVDKAVLEKLADPLLHLLRNGFDHGIEEPAIRLQQGKPEQGTIEINAYYQGNQTVIEVKDDGKGLDLNRIAKKAVNQGLISAQQAASATKEELFNLIFEPGFSTVSQVSELSGRGVGMNIVRSQLETLKGQIIVDSSPGKGATFTLRLPLTLTIAKLLVCSLDSTAFAIPSDSIEEIIIPSPAQIKFSGTHKFLSLNERLIPVYPLKEILEYNCPLINTNSHSKAFETIANPEDWASPLLLLRRERQLFALEVVNLVSEQELVIKPFSKAIAAPNYIYGCTILSDGTLIPAFDGAALINEILGEEAQQSTKAFKHPAQLEELDQEETTEELIGSIKSSSTVAKPQTIMVVDDSTALRRTMALTLEKQGYRVIQKKDGKEALEGFRQNSDIDLIICDIEMPTMNGFEFLGVRRRDSILAKIPVVMLTSRSGAKHRNLAMQLGANAYFTKPYIEQEFVAEIKKILQLQNGLSKSSTSVPKAIASKTILVIDDSSALRRTLALSLERKGYRVLQARDGVEGLDLLKSNLQTNLVICDVEMPNMNGFEFLTCRRQEPQLTKIPVAMLTSRSTDKHRNLAKSLGANFYFTKPYTEEKFLTEIENIVQKVTSN